MRKLPLGPALAAPLVLVVGLGTTLGATLGAGLPFLFGALMRPLGACLSAAAGALTLIGYDLTVREGVFTDGTPFAEVPYTGARLYVVPESFGVQDLLTRVQLILQDYPQLPLLILLWAAIAGVLSLAEWAGRPFVGLAAAAGGGMVGYALLVSPRAPAGTLTQAMTSVFLAAIIYGVLRYLVSRVRG